MTARLPWGRPGRWVAVLALGCVTACGGGGGGGRRAAADLGIDEVRLAASVRFSEETFPPEHCAVVEGALPAAGTRRLLRFDTVIVNHGDLDVVMGDPANPRPPLLAGDFEWSPCHGHYHLSDWADYRLEDDGGGVVAVGHKQAFCLRDNVAYRPLEPASGYDCEYQGLSAGWADVYDRTLDGQWVDVTGVPAGEYWLVVDVDVADYVAEPGDDVPNSARVRVTVPAADAVLPGAP